MRIHRRKAQSILEYTLVIGAVIAAVIAVMLGSGNYSLGKKITRVYTKTSDAVGQTATGASAGVFIGATGSDTDDGDGGGDGGGGGSGSGGSGSGGQI